MSQRTKKLEVGRTKIATIRAKYKGHSGNFDVYYGNICVPYVDGKMMILPKEKYLELLKSFLKNEGIEYIAPTLEEAGTIADRVWAKYEEALRRKKEEEIERADRKATEQQPAKETEPEEVEGQVEEFAEDEGVSEEFSNDANEMLKSERERERECVEEHIESNFVVKMTTKIPENENVEVENDEEKTDEIFILGCETETRFEREENSEPEESNDESESVIDSKEEGNSISGIEEVDVFKEQEAVVQNDEVETESENSSEQHADPPNVITIDNEFLDEIKHLILEQNKSVLKEQEKVISKLDELLSEDKSIELNFDLEGLEKEFKKMNKKISGMKGLCLLSLAASLALGSVAAYFGLGYGDTLTLRTGEEVELHAIVHGEAGDRYSLLGTVSVDENGQITIEGADNK